MLCDNTSLMLTVMGSKMGKHVVQPKVSKPLVEESEETRGER